MKLNIRSIALKENIKDWDIPEHLKPYIKDIYGVYIFNADQNTMCCELTPSYALWFAEYQVDMANNTPDYEREEINQILSDAENCSEEMSYYHTHLIDINKTGDENIEIPDDEVEDFDMGEYASECSSAGFDLLW